jgi:hypothetical protein
MTFEISHNVEKGIRQLLEAPLDLADALPDQGISRPLHKATAAHQEIYRRYLADFQTAYGICDEWWEGCVAAFVRLGLDTDAANEQAYEKRVAGPASAPEFVWFIRSYWLEFDRLNASLSPEERVPPQTALLGWLVDEKRDDFVRLLTCMPYWPIGLDENGNWC